MKAEVVDAYATDIDGFGHRFEPAIDFDADDADQRVSDCIYLERVAARDPDEMELVVRKLGLWFREPGRRARLRF